MCACKRTEDRRWNAESLFFSVQAKWSHKIFDKYEAIWASSMTDLEMKMMTMMLLLLLLFNGTDNESVGREKGEAAPLQTDR